MLQKQIWQCFGTALEMKYDNLYETEGVIDNTYDPFFLDDDA